MNKLYAQRNALEATIASLEDEDGNVAPHNYAEHQTLCHELLDLDLIINKRSWSSCSFPR